MSVLPLHETQIGVELSPNYLRFLSSLVSYMCTWAGNTLIILGILIFALDWYKLIEILKVPEMYEGNTELFQSLTVLLIIIGIIGELSAIVLICCYVVKKYYEKICKKFDLISWNSLLRSSSILVCGFCIISAVTLFAMIHAVVVTQICGRGNLTIRQNQDTFSSNELDTTQIVSTLEPALTTDSSTDNDFIVKDIPAYIDEYVDCPEEVTEEDDEQVEEEQVEDSTRSFNPDIFPHEFDFHFTTTTKTPNHDEGEPDYPEENPENASVEQDYYTDGSSDYEDLSIEVDMKVVKSNDSSEFHEYQTEHVDLNNIIEPNP